MISIQSKRSNFTTTKKIIIAVLVLIALAVLSSCEYNHEEVALPEGAINPCDTTVVKFNTDVVPILTAKCATAGCHDGTGDDPNLSSDLYNQLTSSIGDGKFKTKVIDQRTMPPSPEPPLSSEDYLKLKCWYESGHANN